jgi:hypothetical protein
MKRTTVLCTAGEKKKPKKQNDRGERKLCRILNN